MNVPFFKLLKEEVSSSLAHVRAWSEMIFRLELLLSVEYPSDDEEAFQSGLVHTDGQDQLKSVCALRRCVVVQQTAQIGQ